MTGVVLCGGQSTRMGSDKGLLTQDELTWAEVAVAKLSSLEIPVVVSVNKEQVNLYSKVFSASQLIIDDESILIKGPLLGLLSVHQQFPDEDLLVLACDMVDMGKKLLQDLLSVYKDSFHEACVYTVNGKRQPLCAVYTSKGLKPIFCLYRQGQLKKFSMMYALEGMNTNYISANAFEKHFANYNCVEDLH